MGGCCCKSKELELLTPLTSIKRTLEPERRQLRGSFLGCPRTFSEDFLCHQVFSDSKGQDISTPCSQVFSNFVITDSIFQHLQTSEIINCYVVSKTWSITVGAYLRKRRKVYFVIRPANIPKLRRTVDLLENGIITSNNPFSGLKFCVNIAKPNVPSPFDSEKSKSLAKGFLEIILELLPLKHVAVSLSDENIGIFITDTLLPLFRKNKIETLICNDLASQIVIYREFRNLEFKEWSSLTAIRTWEYRKFCSENLEALLRTCLNRWEVNMLVDTEGISVFDKYVQEASHA